MFFKNKKKNNKKIINKIKKIEFKDLIWAFSIMIILLTTMSSFIEYTYQMGLFHKFNIDKSFLLSYEYSIYDLLYSLLLIIVYFIMLYIIHSFKNSKFFLNIVNLVLFLLLLVLTTYMTYTNPNLMQLLINLSMTIGLYFYLKKQIPKTFSNENISLILQTKTRIYIFIILVIILFVSIYGCCNFISGRFGTFKPKYTVKIDNEIKIVLYNNNKKSILCNINQTDELKTSKIDCSNIITINNENYIFNKIN